MTEEINKPELQSLPTTKAKSRSLWPSVLRWIPTSTDHIIAAEKRLLSLVKTPYVQEQANIGSGPPGSRVRWFRSASNEPRFINTVTFDSKEGSPTLVMVHGYAASQGFFFKNFDYLANRFKVIAIDQLGCRVRLWFTFSHAARKQIFHALLRLISTFHYSFLVYLRLFPPVGVDQAGLTLHAKALKKLRHGLLILLRSGVKRKISVTLYYLGILLEDMLQLNMLSRGLGPWGPGIVRKYTTARFSPRYSAGNVLTEEESTLLTDYMYHTSAAKASGELCLKYIFAFGAFARMPLLNSASEWKVPTTFIYGAQDWMNYQGAQEARKQMKVPCEIIRVPQAGHFVFLENPDGFHSAMLHACRRFLSPHPDNEPFPEGLESA